MDFKIFSSVLAALLAFALIVSVVRGIEQRRAERDFYQVLSTVGRPAQTPKSLDEVMRKAREDRDRNEPSIVDSLRQARLQKESPSH